MNTSTWASWRTFTAGLGTLLAVVGPALKALFDGDTTTTVNWNLTIPAAIAAVGLMVARDDKVTSEQAGAAPKP